MKPSLAELRAVCQPEEVVGRASGEHWAGRLYMRHVSLYFTRWLLPTGITANGVTWLMILSGLAAAGLLAFPGMGTAAGALVLIQLQLLLDCSDGEVARWRRTTGPVGIYLDRIGHYSTEAALLAALGVRADGGSGSIAGWTTLGLLGAVLVLLSKAETDLVHVARALAGLGKVRDEAATAASRVSSLRGLRRVAAVVPFHRAIGAPELTALALVAAAVDAGRQTPVGAQALTAALVVVAGVVAAGHLLVVVTSDRLR